jgi:hypothetical protein
MLSPKLIFAKREGDHTQFQLSSKTGVQRASCIPFLIHPTKRPRMQRSKSAIPLVVLGYEEGVAYTRSLLQLARGEKVSASRLHPQ